MNNTFDTPRLLLKPRTMDDLENCIKMDIHPLVTHYIPGIWDGSTKHITFLKEKILFPYPTGLGYWSIFLKNNPKEFIGWIHLLPNPSDLHSYEIGWRLKHSAWGNGYATEAAVAIIIHSRQNIHAQRIMAYTHVDNVRSINIMNKLGFKHVSNFMYNDNVPSSSYLLQLM